MSKADGLITEYAQLLAFPNKKEADAYSWPSCLERACLIGSLDRGAGPSFCGRRFPPVTIVHRACRSGAQVM